MYGVWKINFILFLGNLTMDSPKCTFIYLYQLENLFPANWIRLQDQFLYLNYSIVHYVHCRSQVYQFNPVTNI